MKKSHFNKIGMVGLAAVMLTAVAVRANDLAAASDKLAEIASMVVEAKFKLAKAANSGDVAAAAQAAQFAKLADASMASAMNAFSAMERASRDEDRDAVASAFNDLVAAGKKIEEAIKAPAPEKGAAPQASITKRKREKRKEAPNPYDVPWETEELRKLAQSLFGAAQGSSGGSGGGGAGFGGGLGGGAGLGGSDGLDGSDATEI